MEGRKGSETGPGRGRNDAGERAREMLSNGSRKIDGKHLSGPLGRKASVVGSTKRIVRVRGIPGSVDA
jgi:hypothetical protein